MIKVRISHLTDGVHEFDLDTTSEVCGIKQRNIFPEPIQVHIILQKFKSHYVCDLHISTKAHFTCDRCLENFISTLIAEDKQTYTTNLEMENETDTELRFLAPHAIEIDLTNDVREILLVSMSQKKLCSAACKGLCAGCGANLNSETCQCKQTQTDPRWSALEKLIH